MKKMSKLGILYPIFKIISSSITPILFMLLIAPQMLENKKTFFFAVIILCVVLIYGCIYWKMFSYNIQGNKIIVHTGIIGKNEQLIMRNKIQNYTYTSWLPIGEIRLFNLYLQLEGNQEQSLISFIGLESNNLEKVKNILNEGENIDVSEKTSISKESIFFIMCQSIISSTVLIFISNFFDILTAVEPEKFLLDDFFNIIKPSNSIVLYMLILTIIIILKNIIKFSSFSIFIKKDTIDISSGLLFTKHSRILRENIKGLLIKENLLQRLFGRASIFLESNDRNEKNILFHPFIKKNEIPHIVQKMYGEDLSCFSKKLNSQGRKINMIFQNILILVIGVWIVNRFQTKILDIIFLLTALIFMYFLLIYITRRFKFTDKYFIYINGIFNKKTQIISKDSFNKISTKKPIYFKDYFHIRVNYFNNSKKKKIRLQSVKFETVIGEKYE